MDKTSRIITIEKHIMDAVMNGAKRDTEIYAYVKGHIKDCSYRECAGGAAMILGVYDPSFSTTTIH
jgi:hypothetical protein